jgi:hypothetical protein
VCTGDARFYNDVLARCLHIGSVDAICCDTVKNRHSIDFTVIILRFDATRAASGRPTFGRPAVGRASNMIFDRCSSRRLYGFMMIFKFKLKSVNI